VNYSPAVSWGIKGATTSDQLANYAASWGLMGDAPPDVLSYAIPTMATMPHIPTMARILFLLFLLKELI
jgi:hypothetical protein